MPCEQGEAKVRQGSEHDGNIPSSYDRSYSTKVDRQTLALGAIPQRKLVMRAQVKTINQTDSAKKAGNSRL